MLQNKYAIPLMAVSLFSGGAMGIAALVSAQTTTSSTTDPLTAQTAVTPHASGDHRRYAPAGGDGTITAINGTTITMAEEADEGGASYTIDASSASFTKGGAAGTLADLKVGDKIFVRGTTNGTSVVASSISIGFPGGHGGMRGGHGHGPDKDGAPQGVAPTVPSTN